MKIFKKIIKIISIIIIIFGVIIFGAEFFNRAETKTASASELKSDVELLAGTTEPVIDVDNNIFNISYKNYNGSNSELFSDRFFNQNYSNFPLGTYTVEINNFIDYSDVNTDDFEVRFLILIDKLDGTYNNYFLSSNEDNSILYTTFNYTDSNYKIYLQILLYPFPNSETPNVPETIDYNFNAYFYAGEYVPGYGQGLAAGIQQGKNEAAQTGQFGIFNNATVDVTLQYDDQTSETLSNLTYTKVYNGVSLQSTAQYLDSNDYFTGDKVVDFANPKINVQTPFTYQNYSIKVSSDSDVSSGYIYTTDGNIYDFEITAAKDDQGYRLAQITDTIPPSIQVSAIEFYVGRPSDLLGTITVVIDSGSYLNGYSVGYNEGERVGSTTGYSNGYSAGKEDGYNQGYTAGQASAGGVATGFMSAASEMLSALFKNMTTLLSTEVAPGINIGLIVIGIPGTFLILDLLISIILKFFKGKGT